MKLIDMDKYTTPGETRYWTTTGTTGQPYYTYSVGTGGYVSSGTSNYSYNTENMNSPDYRISQLEYENASLKNELCTLQGLITVLTDRVYKLENILQEDTKIVKLSEDDKMFNGILDDLLNDAE